jgi:ketosteroid isomerase-like protein
MDPRIVATDGDEVVVQYVTRAMAPDGERFESPVVAIYEVRDGKLARAQMFHYDTAAILAFLERAGSKETAAARIRDADPAYT